VNDPLVKKFCAHWGIRFPEEAIKRAVRCSFPDLQNTKLPVDVESLAYERGVMQIRSSTMEADGIISLIDGGKGYIIDINKSHPENRRRFTIAHEIGHTFFFDLEGELSARSRLQVTDNNLTEVKSNRYEEYLCNLAASEILMPSNPFSTKINSAGPTAKTIITLSRLFKTSIWATSRRLIELCPLKLLVALWEYQSAYDYYQTSWIVSSSRSRSPQKLTVDERVPIFRTFQAMASFRGRKLISLGGEIDDYFVDGCVIKATNHGTILTVFILNAGAGNFFTSTKEASSDFDQMKLFG
jgi:Zn-dependent peptidase ImmA (M78 family)